MKTATNGIFKLVSLLAVSAAFAATALAQSAGPTPPAVAPGSPASSYALSGLDQVNLFNGYLNVQIPLYSITGRGEAGKTITLGVNSQWTVNELGSPAHAPTSNWLGYTYGTVSVGLATDVTGCGPGGAGYGFTYLVWTAPNGTQAYLTDTLYNGEKKPYALDVSCVAVSTNANRGRTFRSYDGSGLTFTLDSSEPDVVDGVTQNTVSGTLFFPNGTQYHINKFQNWVPRITDRNGNQVLYGFTTNPSGTGALFTVTDSAGRITTMDATEDRLHNANDVITYTGATGTHSVTVVYKKMSDTGVLASGETTHTYHDLFNLLAGSSTTTFDMYVVSEVDLPDGSKYSFLYNRYGELVEMDLPTGGKIQYTWGSGVSGSSDGWLTANGTIYRRVLERDTLEGSTVTSKTLFTATSTAGTSNPDADHPGRSVTSVEAKYEDGSGSVLRREIHKFWGDPSSATAVPATPTTYPTWTDGIEFETDVYDATHTSTAMTAVKKVYQQRPCISGENCWFNPQLDNVRANDLQMCKTQTTLDGSAISGTVTGYDTSTTFNRQTDLYEFQYGSAPAATGTCPTLSGLSGYFRHTQTGYFSDSAHNAVNLTHLANLRTVASATGTLATEQWVYDGAAPSGASGLAGGSHDSTFDTSYLARGNVTTHKTTSGTTPAETFAYDTTGSAVSHTDFNGNITAFTYNDGAHVAPTTIAGPVTAAGAQNYTYDQNTLKPVRFVDENGVQTLFEYSDSLDRITAVKRAVTTPAETWTQYVYPSATQVEVLQDQTTGTHGTIRNDTLYDGFGRVKETDQYEDSTHFIATTTSYDALGRTAQTTNPSRAGDGLGFVTAYAFDGLGRVTSVTPPDSSVVTSSYSANTTTVTVPAGSPSVPTSITKTTTTDAAGRVLSVVEDPGTGPQTTSYSYDVLDDLLTVVQGSQTRTFTYDAQGRSVTAQNPESGTLCYGLIVSSVCNAQYDGNGNLLYRSDPRGVVTGFAYDALNRPTGISYSDGTPTVTYSWDSGATYSKGRLVSVSTTAGTVNAITGYDSTGNITSSSQTIGGSTYGFLYSWNLAGALTSETYPSGAVVSTGYDSANRPTLVTNGATNFMTVNSYAPSGGMLAYTFGNSLKRTQNFNNRLQISEIADALTSAPSNPLLDLTYWYGGAVPATPTTMRNNGNPTQIGIQTRQTPSSSVVGFTQTLGYDAVNRIASMAESGLWSQTFGYDQYGNMSGTSTGLTGLPALPASGSYNTSTNQLTAGGVWFDSNGNQKVLGSATLSYDGENRQSIDADSVTGNTITYAYDGLGQRVSKTVTGGFGPTTYVHDALGNLAAEYTYSMGTPSCATCYLSWDHLGSTRMVTDGSGAVIANGRHDFLPFGVEIPGGTAGRTTGVWGGTDYLTAKFTAQERDGETGLDFFQARYFTSTQGRFMSPDQPLLDQDPSDPQSWNLYGYSRNNPLKYRDPTGQSVRICAPNCTPFGISDDQYGAAQTMGGFDANGLSVQGGLTYPSLQELMNGGGYGLIRDSSGVVGQVFWTCDNPGLCGNANLAGAVQIGSSQTVINEFMKQSAINGAAGVAGRLIGAGFEALLAARAAAAPEAVQFGKTANQIYHAFRHLQAEGVNIEEAKDAILSDISRKGMLPQGLTKGAVNIGGRTLNYNAYKFADGTINVGSITAK